MTKLTKREAKRILAEGDRTALQTALTKPAHVAVLDSVGGIGMLIDAVQDRPRRNAMISELLGAGGDPNVSHRGYNFGIGIAGLEPEHAKTWVELAWDRLSSANRAHLLRQSRQADQAATFRLALPFMETAAGPDDLIRSWLVAGGAPSLVESLNLESNLVVDGLTPLQHVAATHASVNYVDGLNKAAVALLEHGGDPQIATTETCTITVAHSRDPKRYEIATVSIPAGTTAADIAARVHAKTAQLADVYARFSKSSARENRTKLLKQLELVIDTLTAAGAGPTTIREVGEHAYDAADLYARVATLLAAVGAGAARPLSQLTVPRNPLAFLRSMVGDNPTLHDRTKSMLLGGLLFAPAPGEDDYGEYDEMSDRAFQITSKGDCVRIIQNDGCFLLDGVVHWISPQGTRQMGRLSDCVDELTVDLGGTPLAAAPRKRRSRKDTPLKGVTVCLTGSFRGVMLGEAECLLEKMGAKTCKKPTSKTDLVITGDAAEAGVTKKANKLGLPLADSAALSALLAGDVSVVGQHQASA